jgi:hypothetical protein
VEGSEADDRATAIAGRSEEVVGEVLAMRAVLFAAWDISTLPTSSLALSSKQWWTRLDMRDYTAKA